MASRPLNWEDVRPCLAVAPHEQALSRGLVRLDLPPGLAELFLMAHRRTAERPRLRFVANARGALLQDIPCRAAAEGPPDNPPDSPPPRA